MSRPRSRRHAVSAAGVACARRRPARGGGVREPRVPVSGDRDAEASRIAVGRLYRQVGADFAKGSRVIVRAARALLLRPEAVRFGSVRCRLVAATRPVV